ncbi:MAG TPA: threonine synthase [Rectinemataceae bacterium]|nr:threonine synthase [Rectinemataceae bacterium]
MSSQGDRSTATSKASRWRYRCPSCGADYAMEPGRYLCGPCSSHNAPGKPLDGVLECVFEGRPERGSIPLPVEHRFFPHIPVGHTPLWEPVRLRAELGFPGLFLKDDTREPSGSFKDRASVLVAAFAREHGIGEIALASTGNAASSMACIGAAAGIKIKVFLPKSAPIAKRIQVLQYGAELVEIDGNYDLAFDTCVEYTTQTGVLSRNTALNPLTIEGKKTASYEIVHALDRMSQGRPDHVFVPTGDGVIIAGIYRGFEDLLATGEIAAMPTIWAAQAEGSSGIARALSTGVFETRPSSTIADSISVDAPRNGPFALAKLKKHGGRAVTVGDAEILEAQLLASSRAGLFVEPSSAAALAGFVKVRGEIGRDEKVVVLLTGSGLKDIRNAARAVGVEA